MNDDYKEPGAREGGISLVPPGRSMHRLFFYFLFGVGVVIIIIIYFFWLIGQNSLDPRFAHSREVSLEEPESPPEGTPRPDTSGRPYLRIAIAPVISPEKSIELYRGLADYFADSINREAVILQRQTYAEVNELVRNRRCDIALVCTYPFIRGEQEFGMEVLVVPVVRGAVTYHSLIVVPQSSRATSLLDLRGKRFASADIMSNSGWLFPAVWLYNKGEDPDNFFSEHLLTGSHDRSILAVASGYVDGAAVDSLVYNQMVAEDPSIRTRARVILKSPPFGMPPFVVHPKIERELRDELLAALVDMHETAAGKEILASLGIDRFIIPEETLFDSVREAARILESNR